MIVGKVFHIDAAHWLPKYEGKCQRLHGHTWHIIVEMCGEPNEKSGMVIDLHAMKELVDPLLERFDHRAVNDLVSMPTCENLAKYIYDELAHLITPLDVSMESVTVQEGEGGYAKYSGY